MSKGTVTIPLDEYKAMQEEKQHFTNKNECSIIKDKRRGEECVCAENR